MHYQRCRCTHSICNYKGLLSLKLFCSVLILKLCIKPHPCNQTGQGKHMHNSFILQTYVQAITPSSKPEGAVLLQYLMIYAATTVEVATLRYIGMRSSNNKPNNSFHNITWPYKRSCTHMKSIGLKIKFHK